MTALTANRKQRLRTLENHIRSAAEQIQKNGLAIGRDLCEIRDDELWKAEGYGSWNQYLKERAGELVGKSFVQSVKFIRAAEVAKRLPSNRISDDSVFTPSHLVEIGRLAPDVPSGVGGERGGGREKDYSRLRKEDVARVLKSAEKLSDGKPPSVRDIRKAVDEELGIDRTAKAAATKEKNNAGIELADYLRQCLGKLQGITNNLAKVPGESWELLEESEPGLATRVAEAAEDLADLMRS